MEITIKINGERVVGQIIRLTPQDIRVEILKRPDDVYLLPHLRDWTSGEQAKVLRAFCKEISITPIRFHDLRATFITQALQATKDLAGVMATVGHENLETTNVYVRKAGITIEGITDKLKFKIPYDEQDDVEENYNVVNLFNGNKTQGS